MLAATLLNLILIIILFTTFMVIYRLTLGDNPDPGLVNALYMVALFGSVFGSFGIYAFILKRVDKKWNLEQKLGRSIWGKREQKK